MSLFNKICGCESARSRKLSLGLKVKLDFYTFAKVFPLLAVIRQCELRLRLVAIVLKA